MTSERFQRRIEQLLDEADQAISLSEGGRVRDRAQNVLALDPENTDAWALIAAANRVAGVHVPEVTSTQSGNANPTSKTEPLSSFANGRYEVKRFLGEGGKKKVYLAHDAHLDRDVAFALIKTEGLDEAARTRVTREVQAMGRLGSHAHIVTVCDIGEENGHTYTVQLLTPRDPSRVAPAPGFGWDSISS